MTNPASTTVNGDERNDLSFWRTHTQISLQPVAAPSILGLFGFAASTFIVSANLAGWYGDNSTPLVLFPFVAIFGGVAQFLAGMWSYRARDGLATAMHGMWGSFWIAYGLYFLLVATRVLPAPSVSHTAQVGFGYWFIVLAAITWLGAAAAVAENLGLTLVLVTLAAGSTLLAIGWVASITTLVPIGAIVLVASAAFAFYTAGAMMLRGTFGRVVLPVGRPRAKNMPGSVPVQPIQYERGEPGVKVGQ
ncbi:MAG TPA: GPR1/FUN34/YaaH family transporter [Pseudonocardiaceae bacterium]|nr:GPR1/FUN34/YaaH family transporter [Pseudonocardiaceae bacterium]